MGMITDNQIRDLAQSGYLLLNNVVPDYILTTAQQEMEKFVDAVIEEWIDAKLIDRDFREFDFHHRFHQAWLAAGKPLYRKRPNRFCITPGMYRILTDETILNIASQVLGDTDIAVHGIFNYRPMLPNDPFTTQIHLDSQFWDFNYGGGEMYSEKDLPELSNNINVFTFWIPLQNVTSESGCIKILDRRKTGRRWFDRYNYSLQRASELERADAYGLSPTDIRLYDPVAVDMRSGDLLLFDQLTPHGSCENLSEHIRWSIDIRYEKASQRAPIGSKFGFIARHCDPEQVTPLDAWLAKRESGAPITGRY